MKLKLIQLFILSSIVIKIKETDLKKEKAEIENHQMAIQKILNELISYISNENTIDITAKIPGFTTNRKEFYNLNIIKKNDQVKKPALKKEYLFDHNLDITDQPWFHGYFPRKGAEEDLLTQDGDFLVRVSKYNINLII